MNSDAGGRGDFFGMDLVELPRRIFLEEGSSLLLYDALRSTQDVARACVKSGEREIVGIIAKHQTAGRGRYGRVWFDTPGHCLLATYILYPYGEQSLDPGALAFITAVAVADAVEEQSGLQVSLKWPNDVLLDRRKLAGILIETTDSPYEEKVALIGIGININTEQFPPSIASLATSLRLQAGRLFSIERIEEAVRKTLFAHYRSALERGMEPIFAQWQQRDITPGSRFLAMINGEEVEGVALGINAAGALRLRTKNGLVLEVLSATSID